MKLFSEHSIGTVDARLWVGDARDCLQRLPRQSVDLIVTSPPYFVGKEYDSSQHVGDFVEELRRVVPAMLNCLKPGGSLCWQVGNHVLNGRLTPLDAIVISELRSVETLILRNRIIWTFGHGTILRSASVVATRLSYGIRRETSTIST